jgi:hypothetical protein
MPFPTPETPADIAAIEAELQRILAPEARRAAGELAASKYLECATPVKCADGFTMSVQASYSHYCSPRDSVGPWHAVEVGFPTEPVEAFMPYIDGEDSDPTDTVYGYVPLKIVAQVVADHGGFAQAEAAQ